MFSVTYRFMLLQTGALLHERSYNFAARDQINEFGLQLQKLGARKIKEVSTQDPITEQVPADADLAELALKLVDKICVQNADHIAWLEDWRSRSGGSTFLKGFVS